jgi:hypothetical protein
MSIRALVRIVPLLGLAACPSSSGGASATPPSAPVDGGAVSTARPAAAPAARPPAPAAGTTPSPFTGTIRVYVAGESIERRNHYEVPPFRPDGSLEPRGGGPLRNDDEEYGWVVPFADRLALRTRGAVRVAWVGTDAWLDGDDNPYTGKHPAAGPGRTSATAGTDIASWLEQRRAELEKKRHCYDVAFASRGGNDYGNEDDRDFEARLVELLGLLDAGSSCRKHPIVYVTGHMPDDQRGGTKNPPDAAYAKLQLQRFVTRTRVAVDRFAASRPAAKARFVDLYTPFTRNQPTTAFPSESWSTGGVPLYAKIGRTTDPMHPRRLASIYVGELAADAIDVAELGRIE